MRLIRLLALAVISLAACSPGSARQDPPRPVAEAQSARHPVSGLPVIDLVVSRGDVRHVFRVELAQSGQEQAQGLMFRERMGADEGMLFPMRPQRLAGFWMKNTLIPLDIVFIGTDGQISNIAANAIPHSLDPKISSGMAAAVLEINGGRAAELGIAPGDRVEW